MGGRYMVNSLQLGLAVSPHLSPKRQIGMRLTSIRSSPPKTSPCTVYQLWNINHSLLLHFTDESIFFLTFFASLLFFYLLMCVLSFNALWKTTQSSRGFLNKARGTHFSYVTWKIPGACVIPLVNMPKII